MGLIKKAKWAYIAVSVVMIALGILLMVFPEMSALTVCSITGAVIIVFGIVKLIGYFSKDAFRLAFQFDFALGIFMIIVGAIIMFHPMDIIKFAPIIIGVFVVLDGALKLQTACDAKSFGMSGWWSILILAVLTCVCGLILMMNPFEGAAAIMILLGATLIVDGIQNLIIVAYTVRAIRSEDERPVIYFNSEDEERKN